jgi:hypothetical protein
MSPVLVATLTGPAPGAETGGVNRNEEDRAVAQVIVRLATRYPDVARASIEKTVHDRQHELADNPVRDYVPVLIEHAAKDRLRRTRPAPRAAAHHAS